MSLDKFHILGKSCLSKASVRVNSSNPLSSPKSPFHFRSRFEKSPILNRLTKTIKLKPFPEYKIPIFLSNESQIPTFENLFLSSLIQSIQKSRDSKNSPHIKKRKTFIKKYPNKIP